MGYVERLKVKPKRVEAIPMCAVQFQAMLACWAASGDLRSNSACKTAADTFMLCLKTTPKGQTRFPSTINYHLLNLTKLKRQAKQDVPGWHHQDYK